MTSTARYLTHPQVAIDPEVPIPDWGLSDVGRARTARLAGARPWPETTVIVASAERKAVETAAILGAAWGVPVRVRPEMHENDRSATGFLPPAAFESAADRFFSQPRESFRGWETAERAQRRILGEVEASLQGHPGGDLLFVGHGAVGTLLHCGLAGAAIDRRFDQPAGGGHWFAFDVETRRPLHHWRDMDGAGPPPPGRILTEGPRHASEPDDPGRGIASAGAVRVHGDRHRLAERDGRGGDRRPPSDAGCAGPRPLSMPGAGHVSRGRAAGGRRSARDGPLRAGGDGDERRRPGPPPSRDGRTTPDAQPEAAWAELRAKHPGGDEQARYLFETAHGFCDGYWDVAFTPPTLRLVRGPCLVVHGDADPLYPVSCAVALHTGIPRASLWIIPGAGHCPIFGAYAATFTLTALDFLTADASDPQET
jgi:broad specificity phosphatase PhoE